MVGEFPSLSETFILDQVTALIDRGHDVTIFAERVSCDAVAHPAVAQYDLPAHTRYERLPAARWGRITGLFPIWRWRPAMWRSLDVVRYGGHAASLRLAWAVRMIGTLAEFDIIQCHFGALGLKAALLRDAGAIRGRIVTAFHGEDITNYPRRFAEGHYDRLFAEGELFQPISGRWNAALEALGCPMDRVRVHRMGIDLGNFPMRAMPRLADTPVTIVAVARLVEKKGLGDAIRAVAQLQCAYEFVIAGDGPLRESLEALISELRLAHSVRLCGPLARGGIADLLRRADIFLAPSVTAADGDIEGIPVAIMEAMATGLPVVSTRHSGIPELVRDDVSGFLVDEGDVLALAGRLSQLAGDTSLRTRMGAAGRRIIEDDFDVRALTDQLIATYEALLSQSRPVQAGRHGS